MPRLQTGFTLVNKRPADVIKHEKTRVHRYKVTLPVKEVSKGVHKFTRIEQFSNEEKLKFAKFFRDDTQRVESLAPVTSFAHSN